MAIHPRHKGGGSRRDVWSLGSWSPGQQGQREKKENNCIIKGMEIKFVGWLTPKTIQNKKASSLIVEFTKPEHANMAIDEGLIIEAAMQHALPPRHAVIAQKRTTQRSAKRGLPTHPQNPSARNACKKRQEEQMKIKRALANRPGRHRTKDMYAENTGLNRAGNEPGICTGPQATDRNSQFNFGDFPRLVPQTQSSQEPSGQLPIKRQRSPTRKAAEGMQSKRQTVTASNRNNQEECPQLYRL
ncbi:hypothetical protein DL95DRAFT_418812 [Leptodontidium sp. 2 PMI_412]|nr:hypothetical protein DL95DRAFT_418812 [Leptodontidium sp. 2 PMI_412]